MRGAAVALYCVQASRGLALVATDLAAVGRLIYESVHAANAIHGVVGSCLQVMVLLKHRPRTGQGGCQPASSGR